MCAAGRAGPGGRETVRLAFAIDADSLPDDAVPAAMAALGLVPKPVAERRVRSTFWDTEGGAFAAAEARLETGSRSARLTIDAGPLRTRSWPIAAAERPPALDGLADVLPAPLREAVLVPAAHRDDRHRTWSSSHAGIAVAQVEMAWSSDGRRHDDRLLVIEGSPRAGAVTIDLAAALAAALPLRLQPRAPEARALDRLAGKVPTVVRVPVTDLEPDMPASVGFAAIGRAALHQIAGNVEGVQAGSAECVHQFRVGLRRMRTALRLFRRRLDDTERRALADDLRWFGRIFGEPREWDVLLAETLRPLSADLDGDPLAALRAVVDGRREAAYGRLLETLSGPEPTRILLRLARWFEAGAIPLAGVPESDPLGAFARKALRRTRRRLRDGHRQDTAPTGSEWHELRLLAKQARYAAEALRSLYPRRAVRPYLAALERLQDGLGALNDATVAARMVGGLADEAADGSLATAAALVAGWAARERIDARHRFDALWSEFRDAEPFWRAD